MCGPACETQWLHLKGPYFLEGGVVNFPPPALTLSLRPAGITHYLNWGVGLPTFSVSHPPGSPGHWSLWSPLYLGSRHTNLVGLWHPPEVTPRQGRVCSKSGTVSLWFPGRWQRPIPLPGSQSSPRWLHPWCVHSLLKKKKYYWDFTHMS